MEKKIRLVATDMDGTLLDSEKRLPKDFVSWVKSHKDIITVIASGRQYFQLYKDLPELKDEVSFIAENGSIVINDSKIIYVNEMRKEDIRSLLKIIAKEEKAVPFLNGLQGTYYVEYDAIAAKYNSRFIPVSSFEEAMERDRIVKIAVFCREKSVLEMASHFPEIPKTSRGVISGEYWVDFSSYDSNKGVALQALMKKKGIAPEECMAFGDYLNDLEMLQSCYYSYAMANALDEIKKVSRFQTDSNDEDGVMKILRKL